MERDVMLKLTVTSMGSPARTLYVNPKYVVAVYPFVGEMRAQAVVQMGAGLAYEVEETAETIVVMMRWEDA